MKHRLLALVLGVSTLAFGSGVPLALSAPLTWTIHIDPFAYTEGGLADISGTFDYDVTTNSFSNINVLVSGVTVASPNAPFGPNPILNGRYDFFVGGSSSGVTLARDVNNDGVLTRGIDGVLGLSFNTFPGLLSTTGSTPIVASGFGFCVTEFTPSNCGFWSLGGASGLATSAPPGVGAEVPLPAALPLLLSALGVFGVFGWRRKWATAAA